VALLDPAPVGDLEVRDEIGVVHAQERLVAVIGGRPELRTRGTERVAERIAPFGFLVSGNRDAEPDARARRVPAMALVEHHRHREAHAVTLPEVARYAPAMVNPVPPAPRPRARDVGVVIGSLPTGPTNGIVDVPGVRVGHATVWHDEPSVARTGVTVIVPDDLGALFTSPIAAGTAVLNGAGELTGSLTIGEWGVLETPIALTSTMAVGRAYDGLVQAMIAAHPGVGVDECVIPTVGECDDSFLDDARGLSVTAQHVIDALADAGSGAVAEGAVGAGAGMTCLGYKGGIGTASRVLDGYSVGVLALTNFGVSEQLVVDGVPVGRLLPVDDDESGETPAEGSCIVVVATDAPVSHAQCERIARRAGLGLARTGSIAHHGSGEIFCAFSTTYRGPREEGETVVTRVEVAAHRLNDLFAATVEATEEAVLNSLFVADTVVGVGGHRAIGLPHDRVVELLRSHGRLR